jgi:hypothetical protein
VVVVINDWFASQLGVKRTGGVPMGRYRDELPERKDPFYGKLYREVVWKNPDKEGVGRTYANAQERIGALKRQWWIHQYVSRLCKQISEEVFRVTGDECVLLAFREIKVSREYLKSARVDGKLIREAFTPKGDVVNPGLNVFLLDPSQEKGRRIFYLAKVGRRKEERILYVLKFQEHLWLLRQLVPKDTLRQYRAALKKFKWREWVGPPWEGTGKGWQSRFFYRWELDTGEEPASPDPHAIHFFVSRLRTELDEEVTTTVFIPPELEEKYSYVYRLLEMKGIDASSLSVNEAWNLLGREIERRGK